MNKSVLKVMMIIIDRNKADKLMSKLNVLGVNFPHVLGIGHSEKSIVFCTVTNDDVIKIKDLLTNEFDLLKKGNGIAFTIPISSVGGPATLQILSGMSFSGGKV